ncbi:MAG: response regulator [Acidobacteriia bacterium]|nr:response regulator [Terriglobia bacterium]
MRSDADSSRARERTILVVDDSESSVTSLEIALDAIPGVRVAFASSAVEAIRSLNREGEAISAVVTDIRMPGMDGFALIRHIRADRAHSAIPIVVVTGDTDPETLERTSQLGANAFFTKPFSPAAVRNTLEKLLYGAEKA